MWLFSTVGFFSIVQCDANSTYESTAFPKLNSGELVTDVLSVRARVPEDLDALRAKYAPKLGETVLIPGRDYPARAYIQREAWAEAMVRIVLDLSYKNYKSEVARVQGVDRAHLYGDVWSVMYGAEQKLKKPKTGKKH